MTKIELTHTLNNLGVTLTDYHFELDSTRNNNLTLPTGGKVTIEMKLSETQLVKLENYLTSHTLNDLMFAGNMMAKSRGLIPSYIVPGKACLNQDKLTTVTPETTSVLCALESLFT